MTSTEIIHLLINFYFKKSKFVIPNLYLFDWESDFLLQRPSGYFEEFEVKTSRSDFKADFKKYEKHEVLETGFHTKKLIKKAKETIFKNIRPLAKPRPNKFWYVCEKGLIKIEDIPSYCGLIWIDGREIIVIKPAPLLHKEKYNFDHHLLFKFYFRMIDQMGTIKKLKAQCNKHQR